MKRAACLLPSCPRRRASSCAFLLVAAVLSSCAGGDPAGGAAVVVRLEVFPPSASVAAGRSQQFSVVAAYDDGSTRDVTTSVSWSSSLPWVAEIDSTGMAKSLHQGSANLVADLANVTGTAQLTVTAPVAEQMRVEPADRALSSGTTLGYDAYATLSDGTEKRVTGSATWRSTNPAVATVSDGETFATPKGEVTAQGNGTAQIVAEYQGVRGATPVTVVPSVIYGGGDMLAALAYVGDSWFNRANPDSSRRLSNHRNPPDPGSLFGSLSSETLVSYCQTGEDIGKFVYAGMNGTRGDNECGDYSGQSQGFSGIGGRPDFAAGELPLTAEEYTRMQEIRGVNAVQIPALAASIAISYNNPEVTWKLNLTSAQLCGILSGAITTWDQISPNLFHNAIHVVYRNDYSAATFALSNHMSFMQVQGLCGGPRFNTSPWFTEVTATVPFDWIGVASSAEAGAKVLNTGFSIGYGEAADLVLRYPDLKLAEVNGIDPLVNLQSPVIKVEPNECVIAGFQPDPAVANTCAGTAANAQSTAPGRPVLADPDPQTTAHNPCSTLVYPDSYANPSSAPEQPPIYPILSISYVLAYNTGNGPAAAALRKLFLAPYSDVTLPPGFVKLSGYAPDPALIESCIGQ